MIEPIYTPEETDRAQASQCIDALTRIAERYPNVFMPHNLLSTKLIATVVRRWDIKPSAPAGESES